MDAVNNLVSFKKKGTKREPQVWCVSAGKGGVGKSFVSTSLAITLSKTGHSVTVIDLDSSGANIHTCFGQNPAKFGIRQFLEDSSKGLQSYITQTAFPHLNFVQGFWDSWDQTEITVGQAQLIFDEAKKLQSDIVIIDLGAGNNKSHLHLFKLSDEKILVTNPEPTSVEKTYRYLESFICYSLREEANKESYEKLVNKLRQHREQKKSKPFSFRNYLKENDEIMMNYFDKINQNPIRIIVNGCRTQLDQNLGYSIKSVCTKYFDLNVDFSGYIDFDNAVWQSIRKKEHVLASQPFTGLGGQFLSISKHLLDSNLYEAVV